MSVWGRIREDYRCYRRPILAQGFWATTIHRFGESWARIRFKPLRLVLRLVHLILIKFSEIWFGIYIGPNVKLGRRCTIEHFGTIIIHAEVKIGDDVRLRQGVTIGNKSPDRSSEVPVIGDRVDIGAGAKLLGGITIGHDARIGANAVVIKDVPPHSVAVGVPARIIPPKKASAVA
jgi:serine O-acetyltransferase